MVIGDIDRTVVGLDLVMGDDPAHVAHSLGAEARSAVYLPAGSGQRSDGRLDVPETVFFEMQSARPLVGKAEVEGAAEGNVTRADWSAGSGSGGPPPVSAARRARDRRP